MNDVKKAMIVSVFGHDLGTASGWDEVGDWVLAFYDFKPNDQAYAMLPKLKEGMVKINNPSLVVSLEEAILYLESDDGKVDFVLNPYGIKLDASV